MWSDPEERKNKKIRKCARNAAYASGLGLGLWIVTLLWEGDEDSAQMEAMFAHFALALLFYGLAVLGFVLFKRDLAPLVNMVLFWFVLPGYILYLATGWTG